MGRHRLLAQRKEARRLQKKGWNDFEDITEQVRAMPEFWDRHEPPTQVFKNNLYSVQVFDKQTAWGPCKKAMIRRHDALPIHKWSDFQRLKNEIWGERAVALEVYPRQQNLTDVANLYWLWVFTNPMWDCPIEDVKCST